MGPETSSAAASSSTTSSPGGKRSRDPEDEVYLDNLHSHKRYLSEIMASSLNGLTVGDPLPENLMESPARSEGMLYLRDDMSMQYSPMSEDSDDSRFCDATINTSSSQADSAPSSPVSPYRYQRPLSGFYSAPSTSSYSSYGCSATTITCSQPRQRGSDSEGRFPSSPSDICHSADLRRAALLRSVQMRTHPPGPPSFELSFGSGQEPVHNMETEERSCSYMKSLVDERTHPPGPPSFGLSFGSGQEPVHNMEAEERSCSYMKSLVDERDYQIEECSSMGMAEPEFNHQKSCRVLDVNVKEDNSVD